VYVRHLTVADFRSWRSADLAFEPGPAVLVGPNGQGKTNLVEALGYAASLSSHRVSTDAPLIRSGAEQAVVQVAVVADARELRVDLEIAAGRSNRARLNGAPLPRVRDVLGVLRAVLFAPEDLAIVRGDPSERRRFLDDLVVSRTPRLAGVRAEYERVLKQRAALLKSAAAIRHRADFSTLDVWDGQLASHGAELLRARLGAVQALQPHAAQAYAQVAPTSVPLTMRYQSALPSVAGVGADPAMPVPDPAVLEEELRVELVRVRGAELDRGVNLVGPHRDDLEIGLGALPVRGYASHGEGWSVALALRLGSYELLSRDLLPGGDPVLILDDVFAELDADRRAQLARAAGKAEQVIVTAAVADDVPDDLRAAAGGWFELADGTVRRAG
jgi:DNA replication and repair protein RecF